MATISEERESLKIRIGKGGANDKLTVIDHTSDTRFSGNATEIFYALGKRIDKGEGSHVIHIVDQAAEKERKRKNPERSTRMMLYCRTPVQWSEMQIQKERYMEIAVDPHIGIDCMIRALGAFSRSTIAEWVKQGFGPGDPPPKAEIPPYQGPSEAELPDWMK